MQNPDPYPKPATAPYLIGITGPIGSGKSTLASHLQSIGYPLYESDSRTKDLLHKDSPLAHELRNDIRALIGPEAFDEYQRYNTAYVSERVFSEPTLLAQLNNIIHPAVLADIHAWRNALTSTNDKRFLLVESALFTLPYWQNKMNATIAILAPTNLRTTRVMHRSRLTQEQVQQRIERQANADQYHQIADLTIQNDDPEPELFCNRVTPILEEFLNKRFPKVAM